MCKAHGYELSERIVAYEICSDSNYTVQRMIDDIGRNIRSSIFDRLKEYITFDEFKGVKNSEANMCFLFIDYTSPKVVIY